jgi:DNA-binding NtrC family response regulator
MEHSWMGNVRELRNTIERAVIISNEGPLLRSHLMLHPKRVQSGATVDDGSLDIRVGMTIEEAERVLLEATLRHAKDNKRRAAATLGISSKTLHAKLKLYRGDTGAPDLSEEEISTSA